MPKYLVTHGSLRIPGRDVTVGQTVEMSAEAFASLGTNCLSLVVEARHEESEVKPKQAAPTPKKWRESK